MKSSSGSTLESYSSDGAGRQITQTDSSGNRSDLYYSSAWQVIEVRKGGNVVEQDVWSPVYVNALLLRDANTTGNPADGLNQRVYAITDANYNVVALVAKPTGPSTWQVVQRYTYDAYGNHQTYTSNWTPTTDAYNWNILYQGGRLDSTSGLYTFQHRQYSASEMRWMQQDPMGYIDGANTYQFVESNPLTFVDPSGFLLGSAAGVLASGTAGATILDGVITLGIGGRAVTGTAVVAGAAGYGIGSLIADGEDYLWGTPKLPPLPLPKRTPKRPTAPTSAPAPTPSRPTLPNAPTMPGPGKIATPRADSPTTQPMIPDPNEDTNNAGRQGQPKGYPYTHDHWKYNSDTGTWERSTVDRDEFGRQTSRTDWTDHGYPNDHTDPHHHITEWSEDFPDGRETGPFPGPAPGHK